MQSKLVLTAAVALLAAGGIGAGVYLSGSSQPAAPAANPEEAAAIATSQGLVSRDGPKLTLHMKSGEAMTLSDRSQCGDIACPPHLAQDFHFQGWDAPLGGYRLSVSGKAMLLPYGDDPTLADLDHADPLTDGPMEQPAPPPPQASADDSVSEWLAEIAKSRDDDEAKPLAAAKGKAERKGAELILTLNDGKHLSLADELSCGQSSCPPPLFRSFAYAGTSPDGRFYLVEERWDEGQTLLLIDTAQGGATELLGPPSFSPNGKFAAAVLSGIPSASSRRLELWDLSGPAPKLAFDVKVAEGDDTLFELDGWTIEEQLKLRRGHWQSSARRSVRLIQSNNVWQINGE